MDTISAISTPQGQGGISVVRVSGPDASKLAEAIFRPTKAAFPLKSHQMVLGQIIQPGSNVLIDQVLCCFMKAPFSYTREDVVEFHCHGSRVVANRVLTLTLAQGARLADPGEFTKRAFLAGRIDLTQAEAVAEMVQAAGEMEADLAAAQLAGGIRNAADRLRVSLIEILAPLEVALDFPDEDEEILNPAAVLARIDQELRPGVENLLASYQHGRVFREGLSVCLSGRPNVGKSSLLNALLNEDRAIVTPQPGTTRDLIHAQVKIRGLILNLLDTAGLSEESRDEIEAEGQRRARTSMTSADLVLLILDLSRPLSRDDLAIAEECRDLPTLVVLNKDDLAPAWPASEIDPFFPPGRQVRVSALRLTGLQELRQKMLQTLDMDFPQVGEAVPPVVPNLRQKEILEKMLSGIDQVRDGVSRNLPLDLVAFEIRRVLDYLGEMTGKTTPDHVLEEIFQRFCLGK